MVSKKRLIFFASSSNMLLINLICFTKLTDAFKQSSWIYLIFFIFIATILGIFFKGFKPQSNILKSIKKNYLLRILISIYLIAIISLITIYISITMKKYFYFKTNLIILIAVLLITSIIVSTGSFKNIIDQASVIMIIFLITYLIPISHLDERDFLLLLPFEFDITKVLQAAFILVFPLDNLLFSLQSDSIENGFDRKSFIMINIFTGFYLLLMIFDTITLTGANFYVDMRYSGLFRWQLFQGNKFIENFSIFLLVMMVITSVYRIAFYFDCLRKTALVKKTKFNNVIIFIISMTIVSILYFYINYIKDITTISLYVFLFILLIFYIVITKISHHKGSEKNVST